MLQQQQEQHYCFLPYTWQSKPQPVLPWLFLLILGPTYTPTVAGVAETWDFNFSYWGAERPAAMVGQLSILDRVLLSDRS